jgi:glutathione S-transferase
MDLVFYTHPMSRGRTVRWMLEEIGQPYRTELLDYATTMKAPAYLAINPMGKVPAITHGGAVVTECGAICTYLADAFPEAGLAPPPGDPRRGPYLRLMFYAAATVEPAIVNRALGVAVPPEKAGMVGYGSLDLVAATLGRLIPAEGWLLGERFSAADLYLGSMLGWVTRFGLLEATPAIAGLIARTAARPAAIRAKQIDDALLPKTG